MKPLLEWKVIAKLINPNTDMGIVKSWVNLGNIMQLQPEMTELWLTDWMSKITNHRNNLVPERPVKRPQGISHLPSTKASRHTRDFGKQGCFILPVGDRVHLVVWSLLV